MMIMMSQIWAMMLMKELQMAHQISVKGTLLLLAFNPTSSCQLNQIAAERFGAHFDNLISRNLQDFHEENQEIQILTIKTTIQTVIFLHFIEASPDPIWNKDTHLIAIISEAAF